MKPTKKSLFNIVAIAILLTACEQSTTSTSTPPNSTASTVAAVDTEKAISETERLNLWFDERYEELLSRSPMRMTRLGRKDKYDKIDDLSEAAKEEKLQWRAATVEELKANFDYDALSEDAQLSYDVWVYQYESNRAMAAYQRNVYVFTQMRGIQSYLPTFLINYHKVENESDMKAYITRIGGISRALDQLLERAKAGAAEGVRPPRFAYETVIFEAKSLLDGAPFRVDSEQDAPLWADAKAKVRALKDAGKIDGTRTGELATAAKTALLENFQPAYSRLIAWFEADIDNSAAAAKGVGALPKGNAYYSAVLAARTTLPLTAEEIHQIGLNEVARLREEMESLKEQIGFEGSLEDFFEYIKTDQQFFYSNDDEGRQRYIDETTGYLDYIKEKLPEYFGVLPKAGLVVKRVESFREQAGGAAHYNAGTPNGSRPGVYYLHLSDMNANQNTDMEATAYHEGNPGHHMQGSIAQELTDIPLFRTQAFFNSFSEGWALYAEALAKEMGAYQNPYSDFGRLSGEMWRAIRLVVDTGIHSMDWTEEEAVAYFEYNSPIPESAIKSEVRRYFVWPGQATSYKIGMLKIQELRAKAEAELGDKFDIRGFHDTILGGGDVPLSVLERMVNNWIERTKAS